MNLFERKLLTLKSLKYIFQRNQNIKSNFRIDSVFNSVILPSHLQQKLMAVIVKEAVYALPKMFDGTLTKHTWPHITG